MIPTIDTRAADVSNPDPLGVIRVAGEVSNIAPVPAIANAINQDSGIRMTETPISPTAVLEAIWEKNGR